MSEPWKDSVDDEPGDAPPASAPRPDTDSIQARVQKSRDLRADAGEEMIRVRGRAQATLAVPDDLPAWARSLDYEHDHVRWANAKLLELESALASRDAEIAEMEQVARCSGDGFQQALDAIRERDAEIARLREALKAARASLAKIHVSDGSYPVYHLICDVLDHPARALAAPPDTTTET
jgi:hypothetical protein